MGMTTSFDLDCHEDGVNLKNSHNLKGESCVLFCGNLRTSSWGDKHLKQPGENFSKEKESGYVKAFQQRAGSLNIRRFLLIKGNQITPVKECKVFLCMERGKSLGSMESFLSYASQLSRASILCFSHSKPPWGSQLSDGCQKAGMLHPECP